MEHQDQLHHVVSAMLDLGHSTSDEDAISLSEHPIFTISMMFLVIPVIRQLLTHLVTDCSVTILLLLAVVIVITMRLVCCRSAVYILPNDRCSNR